MNHFLFFSFSLLFLIYLEKYIYLYPIFCVVFVFKYRYRYLKDFALNLLILFSLFLLALSIKGFIYQSNESFINKISNSPDYVEEILDLNVLRVRAGYIILQDSHKFNIIVSKNKLIQDGYQIIENTNLRAFVRMQKVDVWEKLDSLDWEVQFKGIDSFYLSNKIVYKVLSIDVVQINRVDMLRSYIIDKLEKLSGAVFIKGIVFGMEDYSFYLKKDLIESGIYHYFVASGSNIFLVLNFFYYLLSLFFNRFIALGLGMFFVFVYCWVVGFDPPLLRAFIFSIFANIFIVYKIENRLLFSLISICFVWIVFLFLDFWGTLGLSFKLSFLSFMGVIYIGGILKDFVNFKNKIYEFLFDNLVINFSVLMFMFPIFLEYFQVFYLNGLFSNIIIAIFIPLIFSCTLVYLLLPIGIVYFLVDYVFRFFVLVIEWLISFKPIILELNLSMFYVIGYYFLLSITGGMIEILKNNKIGFKN